MIKNLLNIIFIFLLTASSWAQNDDGPVRVEFDARAEVFEVIPCGVYGALMFYESIKEFDENNKVWVFVFYDRNLNPLWSKEVPVFKDMSFLEYNRSKDDLFLAFQNKVKIKHNVYNFQLLKINLLDATFNPTNIFVPDKTELVNFDVYKNRAAIGLNFWKDKAMLVIRDLSGGSEITVPFRETATFIEDTRFDTVNSQILVVINVYSSRKRSDMYLNAYNFQGELMTSILIAPPVETEKLMNAQLNFVTEDTLYLLGSFNNLNGKFSRTEEDDEGEESEGFYIAEIENGKQSFIRFHKLLDFKNITTILNNEELPSVQDLINKNKRKGKADALYYEFLIHDLKRQGDDFIMLAEAYYPEYHQISTMTYDFYGRPMPYYYTIFDGYRHFNAFVASFNKDGELNWSNGMKIWNMISMYLAKRVEMSFDGEEAVLFYNHEGKIVSKVLKGYQDIGDVEKTKIATSYPNDVQLDASKGRVVHWYGNFYLASGYQTLRNSSLGGGSKRHVFYFNKVVFN
nr:hypothetical protein [Bacteroidota bacterium]